MNILRSLPVVNWLVVLLLSLLGIQSAQAQIFTLPSNGDNVVGKYQTVRSLRGEHLWEVGRRFDIGYYEMLEANPRLSKRARLSANTEVVIPSRFILPAGPRRGIVVNLAELRLYYYIPGTNQVLTEPVGIGRVGWTTPLGQTHVIEKMLNPEWRPTADVRADAERLGYVLPDVWPAGPDNPLGQHALRMGWSTYLIHGTNRPEGVGQRSSAGCIRMFPEDIKVLFSKVRVGTPIRIMNVPVKIGWQHQKLYLESHQILEEQDLSVHNDTIDIIDKIHKATRARPAVINWSLVKEALQKETGLLVNIGAVPNLARSY